LSVSPQEALAAPAIFDRAPQKDLEPDTNSDYRFAWKSPSIRPTDQEHVQRSDLREFSSLQEVILQWQTQT